MIRKAIIVVLTVAAVGTGMIGAVAVPGFRPGRTWDFGEPEATGYSMLSIVYGPTRLINITYSKFLDGSGPPVEKRWRGTLWAYQTNVVKNEPSGRYLRVHTLTVSFVIPVVISVLSATYPAIAFVRGPLRRYRRRRKGLCLKCGYDLTGNVSGVCPECGTEVQQP